MFFVQKKGNFSLKYLRAGVLLSVVAFIILSLLIGCSTPVPTPQYTVGVRVNRTEAGDISMDMIHWKDQESKIVNENTEITLYANTESFCLFNGWYEDGRRISTDNPMTMTINANHKIMASFRYGNGPLAPDVSLLEKGEFRMGDEYNVGTDDELPLHHVTLTKDIYMGKYEITNNQFVEFLNGTGVVLERPYGNLKGRRILFVDNSVYSGIDHNGTNWYVKTEYDVIPVNYMQIPVVYVTWFGAVEYCNWLSEENGLEKAYQWDETVKTYKLHNYPDNEGYRLPTEAEWEYAARAGQNLKWSGTSEEMAVGCFAWYFSNSDIGDGSGKHVQLIDQKLANSFGLMGMSGNASEWCSDNWYDYQEANQTDPYYVETGHGDVHSHVVRGGSFADTEMFCRVAERNLGSDHGVYRDYLGFRVVRHP